MTTLLVAVFVVVALAAVVLLLVLRRRAGREEPKPVSIERRLGPTRSPIDPDRGSSLEFRSVRSVPAPSGPLPELPPDPWGLEPDRSVAPFLAPSPREDPDEQDPPQAAQQP